MKNWLGKLTFTLALLTFLTLNSKLSTACAQETTAFTYQGQLRDNGTNANGTYTMIFKLYDAVNNGNLVAGPITTNPTLANGLFTVNLDFGAGAFNGLARWLDITVQSGSDSEELSPRVQVLPTPYAQFATSAATLSTFVATFIDTNILVSSDAWNIAVSPASHSLVFTDNGAEQMVLDTNGAGIFFPSDVYAGGTFYGNGGGLTNLDAVPQMQVFNTPGTYQFIVPTNVTRIMLEVWGGGGGGGTGPGSEYDEGGSGGGGGGYGKESFNVTPGANYTITVGAGGNTDSAGNASSFGSLINASGGNAGNHWSSTTLLPLGGTGGSSSASLNITGQTGDFGNSSDGGDGGGTGCGGSGGAADAGNGGGAESGHNPGGGGGGGAYNFSTGNPDPGASGGNGEVIIYY